MTGADGYELSDRWQESLQLKRLVRALWQRLEEEIGEDASEAAGGTLDAGEGARPAVDTVRVTADAGALRA